MPRILSSLFIIMALLALPLSVDAEEPVSQEFEEIVVTATRTERKSAEVPAAVSVVTEEQLEDMPLLGPREALTGLPGVQAETRNNGYDARLIIRGAGLKARYGVREIMVLLDGVPITDPDGMTRLDFVDTQLIEQVEVVRGPNSTLYGANASGGVINITTRNPFEERKSLRVGYGADNTQLLNGLYGTHFGSTFLTLSATHKQSDGWREWNEFKSDQASLRLGHLFDDGSSLEGVYSYTEADLQLPGTLTETEFKEDPGQLTSEPFRHNGRYSTIHSGNLRYEKELGAWALKPLVYLQSWEHYHPVPGTINDGGSDIVGVDLQGNRKHALFGIPATLTLGTAGQLDDGDNRKYTYRDVMTSFVPFPPPGSEKILFTLSDARGDLAEISAEQVSKAGVYLQESLEPGDDWIIDLGIRYDRVKFDIDSKVYREFIWGANSYRTYETPLKIDVNETFDAVSPRLGVVYRLTEELNLYGNISTGFQTPQASELSDNPDLDPAVTYNYEAGIKYRHADGHSLDMTVFWQEVEDEIVQTLLADNQVAYSNAGQTDKFGVEVAGRAKLPYDLVLYGSYTYSDFTFNQFDEPLRVYNPDTKTTEVVVFDRSGNQLPYIPRHQYSLGLSWQHSSGFKARIDTYSWGEYWVDNANSEKYGGYDLLTNLLVGWEKGPWDLSLDISNLFDKTYAMEVTKSADDLLYRPGAPRTWFAKLSYAF